MSAIPFGEMVRYTLVLEVVANACDQHFAGRCSLIDLEIAADGTIAVRDDGPGMSVHGGDGEPPLEVLLTRRSERPTVDGHRPHVHLGMGGIGLFVVNALSERFEIATVHHGVEARAIYARGEPVEALASAPTPRPSGTRIQFRPDPEIFRYPRVPRAQLTQRLEDLAFLLSGLALRWRVGGDELAAGGLAASVACRLGCPLDAMASYRGSFDTPSGPIDVEVALAWRMVQGGYNASPKFDSFVNLERSASHGTHVDGLIDGIAAFLGGKRRRPDADGVVAAVAVVLSDVKWGNPRHDKLESPEARVPVAEATHRALACWAKANPEAADALRKHKRAALSRQRPDRGSTRRTTM